MKKEPIIWTHFGRKYQDHKAADAFVIQKNITANKSEAE